MEQLVEDVVVPLTRGLKTSRHLGGVTTQAEVSNLLCRKKKKGVGLWWGRSRRIGLLQEGRASMWVSNHCRFLTCRTIRVFSSR